MQQRRRAGLWMIVGAIVTMLAAGCGGTAPATALPPTAAAKPAATAPAAATTAPAATATLASTARPVATTASSTPAAAASPSPVASRRARDFIDAKYGGVLRADTAGDPPGWDAHKNLAFLTQIPATPLNDQLVGNDPARWGEYIPLLAKSWSLSPDGLVWTFNLNQGVHFHDGTPFTAADVVYTMDKRVMNPPQGLVSQFKGQVESLKEVKALDDYRVQMTLKESDASFLALGIAFGRMNMISKAWTEANGMAKLDAYPPPPLLGPFKAKEYVRGSSIELVKNTDYYMPDRPFLDGIKIFIISDTGTLFASLLTGQIDFMRNLSVAQQKEAKDRLGNKITIQPTPVGVHSKVDINTLAAPFNDVRVRKALNYAIDKDGFNLTQGGPYAIGGYLQPGTGWEMPLSELKQFAGYDPDLKANQQKAKDLLAEAGYPNGLDVVWYMRDNTLNATVALQSMLKEVGMRSTYRTVDTATYFNTIQEKGNATWQISQEATGTVGTDPNAQFGVFHVSWGSRTVSNFKSDYMDATYRKQNVAVDPAARKALLWDMERYAQGQYAYDVLGWSVWALATRPEVHHLYQPPYHGGNQHHREAWLTR